MALNFGGNSTLLGGNYPSTPATPGWETGNYASASASAGSTNSFGTFAPYMMALGAVQSAVGTYYASETAKFQYKMQGINSSFQLGMQGINAEAAASNLEFNAQMADLNAKMAENTAQFHMWSGQQQIGQVTMRAGKIKSAQRASQAARGIVAGVGSAAEEIATTDLMKETDAITININATKAAGNARMQRVNYENQSLLSRTSAASARSAGQYYTKSAENASSYYGSMSDAVNPWMSVGTSLIGSASSYMNTMYRDQKFADYIASISQSRT